MTYYLSDGFQEKLFMAWLRITELRYSVAEKRIEMQRLIDGIKLHEVLTSQICLLSEWEKLERKHSEGMSKMIRKLSAFSNNVPLLHGAQVMITIDLMIISFSYIHIHTHICAWISLSFFTLHEPKNI